MKHLFTSYYAKAQTNPLAVAISVMPPRWNKEMRHCQTLAPSPMILRDYKDGLLSVVNYSERYLAELDHCGQTAQEIVDGLPEGSVLLCFEKTGSFCHRHLAAAWLMAHADVEVKELP